LTGEYTDDFSVITFGSILVTIRLTLRIFAQPFGKLFDSMTLTRRQMTLSKISMTLTILRYTSITLT